MGTPISEHLKHFDAGYKNEIKEFAHKEVFRHYVFVRKKGKERIGYCTYCKETIGVPMLMHNEIYNCPNCHTECLAKQAGRGRKHMIDQAYFIYYEKSLIDKDVIVARGIYAVKDYSQGYTDVEIKLATRSYYIFKIGNPTMITTYCYYNGREMVQSSSMSETVMNSLINQWPAKNRDTLLGESFNSIQKAVTGTPYQYSCFNNSSIRSFGIVKYFELYSKYPFAVEALVKLGFGAFVSTKIHGGLTHGAINWNGKTVQRVFRLNKADIKLLRNFQNTDLETVRLFQISKKDGSKLSIEEIREIEKEYLNIQTLYSVLKYSTLRRAFNYLKKQNKLQRKQNDAYYSIHRISNLLVEWRDYIKNCEYLEKNLNVENVLFPKDLMKTHRATIKQVKVKENAILNEKIQRRSKLLERYCFEFEGLLIRPAASHKELIKEGDTLGHCVATNYSDKYANGQTNIFFIRRTDSPDKPFYTVEIKGDKVIQVQGKTHIQPTKEVKKFMEAFEAEKLNSKSRKSA